MSNVLSYRVFYNLRFSNKFSILSEVESLFSRRFYGTRTNRSRLCGPQSCWLVVAGAFATGIGANYWLKAKQPSILQTSLVLSAASNDEEGPACQTELTIKQMKFEEYASYEYGGKRLMSPQDFLNSLVESKKGAVNL